jgi:LPS O-antigen subunit length determinant protein (WzzB/FepE family)
MICTPDEYRARIRELEERLKYARKALKRIDHAWVTEIRQAKRIARAAIIQTRESEP